MAKSNVGGLQLFVHLFVQSQPLVCLFVCLCVCPSVATGERAQHEVELCQGVGRFASMHCIVG